MKIKRYQIKITVDIVHGWTDTIDEVYVPEVDLFINRETCFIGGDVNKGRVPSEAKEEDIPDSQGIYIVRLANSLREQAGVIEDIRNVLFKE